MFVTPGLPQVTSGSELVHFPNYVDALTNVVGQLDEAPAPEVQASLEAIAVQLVRAFPILPRQFKGMASSALVNLLQTSAFDRYKRHVGQMG